MQPLSSLSMKYDYFNVHVKLHKDWKWQVCVRKPLNDSSWYVLQSNLKRLLQPVLYPGLFGLCHTQSWSEMRDHPLPCRLNDMTRKPRQGSGGNTASRIQPLGLSGRHSLTRTSSPSPAFLLPMCHVPLPCVPSPHVSCSPPPAYEITNSDGRFAVVLQQGM